MKGENLSGSWSWAKPNKLHKGTIYNGDYLKYDVIAKLISAWTRKGGKFLKKLWCCVGGSIAR